MVKQHWKKGKVRERERDYWWGSGSSNGKASLKGSERERNKKEEGKEYSGWVCVYVCVRDRVTEKEKRKII